MLKNISLDYGKIFFIYQYMSILYFIAEVRICKKLKKGKKISVCPTDY